MRAPGEAFVPKWENSVSRGAESAQSVRARTEMGEVVTSLVSPDDTILDCGCGWGRLYRTLAELGTLAWSSYAGMEYTASMVEVARTHIPDAEIIKGSIEDIPLHDEAVQVTVAMAVIETLDGYEKAVRELLRVAKRAAVIGLSQSSTRTCRGWSTRPGIGDFRLNIYDPREINQYALRVGASSATVVRDRRVGDALTICVLRK